MNPSDGQQSEVPPWLIAFDEQRLHFTEYLSNKLRHEALFCDVPGRPIPSLWALGVIDDVSCGDSLGIDGLDINAREQLFFAAMEARQFGDAAWRATAVRLVEVCPELIQIGQNYLVRSIDENTPESAIAAIYAMTVLRRHAAHNLNHLQHHCERLGVSAVLVTKAITSADPVRGYSAWRQAFNPADVEDTCDTLEALSNCGDWAYRSLDLARSRLKYLTMGSTIEQATIGNAALEFLARVGCEFPDYVEYEINCLEELLPQMPSLEQWRAIKTLAMIRPHDPATLPRVITLWRSLVAGQYTQMYEGVDWSDLVIRQAGHMMVALLPKTEDEELNDFARRFVPMAFHPYSGQFVNHVVYHSFYRRLQRHQLKLHARFELSASELSDLVEDACQMFAVRLLERPGLGISPERCAELPGYLHNTTRAIARQLLRKTKSAKFVSRDLKHAPIAHAVDPCDAIESKRWIKAFQTAFDCLSHSHQEVLIRKLVEGQTWTSVASAMNKTESQVRTLFEQIRRKVSSELNLPLTRVDKELLIRFLSFVQKDSDKSPGP